MLRGWSGWRGIHRALAALLLALWLPVPYGSPLLAATTSGGSMGCCRHKNQCCCRKQSDPAGQEGPALRATLCGNGCKIAALSGPVAPVLVATVSGTPIPAFSGSQPSYVPSRAVSAAVSWLYQRPPPFYA